MIRASTCSLLIATLKLAPWVQNAGLPREPVDRMRDAEVRLDDVGTVEPDRALADMVLEQPRPLAEEQGRDVELDLVDEIKLHIAPLFLGEGTRLFENHVGEGPVRLDRANVVESDFGVAHAVYRLPG